MQSIKLDLSGFINLLNRQYIVLIYEFLQLPANTRQVKVQAVGFGVGIIQVSKLS